MIKIPSYRDAFGGMVKHPNLKIIQGDSGIANIPTSSTINSTTVAASVVVRGYDADATTLPLHVGGVTLGIAGGGTDPLLAQPALGNGTTDVSLTGQASNYYIDSGTTVGNIGTNDPKFKVIGKVTGTTSVIAAKRNGAVGWEIGIDASDRMYCTIDDGVGSATIVSAALEIGTFIDADLYLDRSGSGQWYVDNAASGSPVVISGAALTLDSATSLSILADSGGNSPTDFGLVYFSLTNSAAWFSTHLNATDHATDFYKWSGLYPKRATGTALPTFYTRAGSATAEKWNGTAYDILNCGAGVPRVDWQSNGFKGMIIEPGAVTNLFQYSEDSTQWTAIDAGDVFGAAAGKAPNREDTLVSLTADSTDGQHGGIESDNPTLTAANYTYSRYFLKGDNDLIWLEDTTVANTQTWFNLATGAVGTNIGSAVVDTHIKGPFYSDLGDIYRVGITILGTAAAHTFNWGSSVTDGDETFPGDGATVNCYTWGAQCVVGNLMSSYIATTGATVTRPADSLQYNGDNVTAGQGAFVADVLIDDFETSTNLRIFTLDDGSNQNWIGSYVNTSDTPAFLGVNTGGVEWNIGGNDDITDGDAHKIRCIWETNNAKQYVDGALDGTPDTSNTPPTGITAVNIGQYWDASQSLNGRIRNIQIWPWAEENLG
jgi:hypothetical protein